MPLLASKKNFSLTVTYDNFKIDINGFKIESSLEQTLLVVLLTISLHSEVIYAKC